MMWTYSKAFQSCLYQLPYRSDQRRVGWMQQHIPHSIPYKQGRTSCWIDIDCKILWIYIPFAKVFHVETLFPKSSSKPHKEIKYFFGNNVFLQLLGIYYTLPICRNRRDIERKHCFQKKYFITLCVFDRDLGNRVSTWNTWARLTRLRFYRDKIGTSQVFGDLNEQKGSEDWGTVTYFSSCIYSVQIFNC